MNQADRGRGTAVALAEEAGDEAGGRHSLKEGRIDRSNRDEVGA